MPLRFRPLATYLTRRSAFLEVLRPEVPRCFIVYDLLSQVSGGSSSNGALDVHASTMPGRGEELPCEVVHTSKEEVGVDTVQTPVYHDHGWDRTVCEQGSGAGQRLPRCEGC